MIKHKFRIEELENERHINKLCQLME